MFLVCLFFWERKVVEIYALLRYGLARYVVIVRNIEVFLK